MRLRLELQPGARSPAGEAYSAPPDQTPIAIGRLAGGRCGEGREGKVKGEGREYHFKLLPSKNYGYGLVTAR